MRETLQVQEEQRLKRALNAKHDPPHAHASSNRLGLSHQVNVLCWCHKLSSFEADKIPCFHQTCQSCDTGHVVILERGDFRGDHDRVSLIVNARAVSV